MKTALLTGANGFTGRYLEPALQQRGYEIARVDPAGPQPCDLTDRACVERTVLEARPDVVVHLAGITFVAHSGVEDFYRVNALAYLICWKHWQSLSGRPAA